MRPSMLDLGCPGGAKKGTKVMVSESFSIGSDRDPERMDGPNGQALDLQNTQPREKTYVRCGMCGPANKNEM